MVTPVRLTGAPTCRQLVRAKCTSYWTLRSQNFCSPPSDMMVAIRMASATKTRNPTRAVWLPGLGTLIARGSSCSGQELVEPRVRRGPRLLRRAREADRALVQERDPVGDEEGARQVVRDDDGREPEPALQVADQVVDPGADHRVEAGRRLVVEKRAGLEHQRAGERGALSHAAGELRGHERLGFREVDHGERFAGEPVEGKATQHALAAERLLEPGAADEGCAHVRRMSFVRKKSETSTVIEATTTVAVVARPTPSAPPVVPRPFRHAMMPMKYAKKNDFPMPEATSPSSSTWMSELR